MNQVERAIRVAELAIKERDDCIQQLAEALRYIAEFDAKMKMHRPPARDAPMNVVAYAFALGAVQGRARAALGDLTLREPRAETPVEKED